MLIFRNGTARFSKGGDLVFDVDGNPVKNNQSSSATDCYIDVLSEDKKGRYDDGRYKNCSYSVLFDAGESADFVNGAVSVELTHVRKGLLGVFTIQRIEFYDITGSIEIWV